MEDTTPGAPAWAASPPTRPLLHQAVERLGALEQLDPFAERVAGTVGRVLGAPPVKDALSGTWMGHAAHPMLTDVTIGAWLSATLLDLAGGRDARGGADRLVAAGILSALPTAASGLSDWSDTGGATRRIGMVHAAANVTALSLYTASLAARRRGRRGRGVALGLTGMGVLGLGGLLGGHLAYARGVGVDQTVFEDPPAEWATALAADRLQEGRPERGQVGGVDILLVRQAGRIFALADRCTHRGGPLHEGSLDDGCITCPWHGSTFGLDDGSVARGPATAPQPGYDVRIRDGQVEVRARAAAG